MSAPETGILNFVGETGLFLKGQQAVDYAAAVRHLAMGDRAADVIAKANELVYLLESCTRKDEVGSPDRHLGIPRHDLPSVETIDAISDPARLRR